MDPITTYVVIIFLVSLSALFSGLNLGLMGLNIFTLKRKVALGDKNAIKVYPLRVKGNQLLCTLLLGNVLVNSVLAIFLGSITIGIIAVILSTGLIVIFGEIVPQALFSKHALKFSAKFSRIIFLFFYILFPLTYPISKALDKFLGGELPSIYSKKEIRLLLEQQYKLNKSEIDKEEFEILRGGLIFSDKIVKDVMTPRVKTYFLKKDAVLNKKLLDEIQEQAHSRIPVYDDNRDKVVGLLYTKDLISLKPTDKKTVGKVMRRNVIFVKETERLDEILNLFRQKRTHLFIVLDDFKGTAGIITLEDVLEEIVGEIVDEYDSLFDED